MPVYFGYFHLKLLYFVWKYLCKFQRKPRKTIKKSCESSILFSVIAAFQSRPPMLSALLLESLQNFSLIYYDCTLFMHVWQCLHYHSVNPVNYCWNPVATIDVTRRQLKFNFVLNGLFHMQSKAPTRVIKFAWITFGLCGWKKIPDWKPE